MNVRVSTELYCYPVSEIDIPVKTWEEIREWFVKWDTFHYTVDGKNWEEISLNNDTMDAVDWKRPISVRITDSLSEQTYYNDDE